MINSGKFSHSLSGICHNDFRSLEALSFAQRISKVIRMDSHSKANLLCLVTLDFTAMVSAVYKSKSETLALFLRCISVTENHKWVIVMAGTSSSAAHRADTMSNRHSFHLAFHTVFAVEMNQIKLSLFQIKLQRHCLSDCYRFFLCIFNPDCPCNYIKFRKNTVQEMYLYAGSSVAENNFQTLSFFLVPKHCRKSLQSIFALSYCIKLIFQICRTASVRHLKLQRIDTVIPVSGRCILLRKGIKRKTSVQPCLIGISGKASVLFHDSM